MDGISSGRKLAAELIGTAMLLATVVGSGIMAEKLAGGNVAIALLGNTLPTGAMLVVLITILGPVSGAHFNPAVTGVMAARGELGVALAGQYVVAQVVGGVLGVLLAHAMFDLSLLQVSTKARSSTGQWIAEAVATFGLLVTILGALRVQASAQIPMLVGLYITGAYWFTASTSFANPAVTFARCFSDTFAGIAPASAPAFMAAQIAGAAIAVMISSYLFTSTSTRDARA